MESTSPTRKATVTPAPARGKTLGRHVSAASRPKPESGDVPARETSIWVRQARRSARVGQHPGRGPATIVRPRADSDKPEPRVGLVTGRASAGLRAPREVPLGNRPSGPSTRGSQSPGGPRARQAKGRLASG